MSKEKKDRNRQIHKDRKAGLSWRELIQKHNLSETRLRQIVAQEKVKNYGSRKGD